MARKSRKNMMPLEATALPDKEKTLPSSGTMAEPQRNAII